MKNFLVFPAILLFLTVQQGVFAQNTPGAVGLPSITQLRAEVKNNLIRLTWVDSPEAKGPVYIFRAARPFSGGIPPNSRPVVVQYGMQYYVDDSEDMETLYYFIAASNTEGRRFDSIVSQRNSTTVNLTQIQSEEDTSAVEIAAEEEPVVPVLTGVSGIRATLDIDGEGVVITYSVSGEKNVILYRSAQAVRQPQDLINAVIIQSQASSPFVDYPIPGVLWYYAAIPEDDVFGGNIRIRQGNNVTADAIAIPAAAGREDWKSRPIPLPILAIHSMSEDNSRVLPQPHPLGAQASRAAERFLGSNAPLLKKEPFIFESDMRGPASGEESAMVQIVQNFFVRGEWNAARTRLQNYLSLPVSEDVQKRARFYLGQTLYFTDNYKEALFEFLSIQSYHPEVDKWIDAVLSAMVH